MTNPASDDLASLDELRARGFVGRADQLAAIRASLRATAPQRVHLIHGAGGIGKTTLLDAVERLGREQGWAVHRLDARDVVCSVDAITDWYGAVENSRRPGLLLIDGYELLAPLDQWFRAAFLPSLLADTVTVLAGRDPPSAGWWLDAGWRRLAAVHSLQPFGPADSDALLERLDVPAAARPALARLAKGHPLVLAMLAEASRHASITGFEDAPDVVSRLCAQIIDDVPSPAHRMGLATCAHTLQTTQDLLERTVADRVEEVWAWLEARPYVRHGTVGLYLHDVVRALFEAEFRHRSPDGYITLHRTVRWYFEERMDDPLETHPLRAATEILLLHRRGPLSSSVGDLPMSTLPPVTRATSADHGWMLDLLERTESASAARLAARWFARESSTGYRIRVPGGPSAFAYHAYLDAPPEDLADPVATTIWNLVARRGALRPGERIHVNRFAAATGGPRDNLLLLVAGTSCTYEWRCRPAAWTFLVTPAGDYHGDYFAYLGMQHMLSVDLGDGPVDGWGWDRRRLDPLGLSEMMAHRELTGEIGPPPAHLLRPAPLSREDFDRAVRTALSALTRPDRLVGSPLLGTALVRGSDPDELASRLVTSIAALAAEPRGDEHRRVLERTYVHPAPSQEIAAELLDLPFSTYRRHLALAVQRLCDVLWAVEIGSVPRPGQKVSSDRPGE